MKVTSEGLAVPIDGVFSRFLSPILGKTTPPFDVCCVAMQI
jgi:hypothetical protein